MIPSFHTWMMDQEARALLARLEKVKPFVLHETMVPAAAISPATQRVIEQFLSRGRAALRDQVHQFLRWMSEPEGRETTTAQVQSRFVILRMRFNDILSQFDLFADVLTQRSEHETGVWLSGLDVLAADLLALPEYYTAPPAICYLDRGPGAAIRRARTRLPGGDENPVAIIRVPRERMIGSGIVSSLAHEVGHQGAALLDLVDSLRSVLRERHEGEREHHQSWQLWEHWISEILADFWGVAKVGVASTLGLISVMSLPHYFVFRMSLDDPHPIPWIRVKLSCAIGNILYPHPQWRRLARFWESLYPRDSLDKEKQRWLDILQGTIPDFVLLLVQHRPKLLRGASLREALSEERQPAKLAYFYQAWRVVPAKMRQAPPSLVFAVLGQARADGQISPEEESRILAMMLTYWALRRSLGVGIPCAQKSHRLGSPLRSSYFRTAY